MYKKSQLLLKNMIQTKHTHTLLTHMLGLLKKTIDENMENIM